MTYLSIVLEYPAIYISQRNTCITFQYQMSAAPLLYSLIYLLCLSLLELVSHTVTQRSNAIICFSVNYKHTREWSHTCSGFFRLPELRGSEGDWPFQLFSGIPPVLFINSYSIMSERKACITIYLPVWVRWFENAVVMLNGSLKMVQGHYLTLGHVRWLAGLRR